MDQRKPDLMVRIYAPSDEGTTYSTIELFKGTQFSEKTLGDQSDNPDLGQLFRVRIDRSWYPQAKPVALFDAAVILTNIITHGVLPDILQEDE